MLMKEEEELVILREKRGGKGVKEGKEGKEGREVWLQGSNYHQWYISLKKVKLIGEQVNFIVLFFFSFLYYFFIHYYYYLFLSDVNKAYYCSSPKTTFWIHFNTFECPRTYLDRDIKLRLR